MYIEFQSFTISITPNIVASRHNEIWRQDLLLNRGTEVLLQVVSTGWEDLIECL